MLFNPNWISMDLITALVLSLAQLNSVTHDLLCIHLYIPYSPAFNQVRWINVKLCYNNMNLSPFWQRTDHPLTLFPTFFVVVLFCLYVSEFKGVFGCWLKGLLPFLIIRPIHSGNFKCTISELQILRCFCRRFTNRSGHYTALLCLNVYFLLWFLLLHPLYSL